MHVFTGLVQLGLAHALLRHGFRQGVPGSQILPSPIKRHDGDALLMFRHRIIETDLLHTLVTIIQILIVRKAQEFPGALQNISNLIGKHAAVPQRPLTDILFCRLLIRLLFEGVHRADHALFLGQDIPILLTGVGRRDAHEHQLRRLLFRQRLQCLKRSEIIRFHVRIHWAYYHSLFLAEPLHIPQIGRSQYNRREGVAATGFYRDSHILAQLVMQGRNLCLGGGHRHPRFRIRLPNLPVYTLHHRLIGAVFLLKNANKLLGSNVIGQGPQPFSGAAG